MTRLVRCVSLIALAALVHCGGSETGNPFRAEIRVHAHSSDPTRVAVAVGAGGATVTGAWISAGALALVGEDCVTSPGATASLPSGDYASSPAPTLDLDLLGGVFCGARLPLELATGPGDAPTALVGHSVLVVGERADGTPFQLRSARAGQLVIAGIIDGFELDEEQRALFLGFDVATWLADLDLDGVEPGPDGIVDIDAVTDPARAAIFDDNLAAGVELYRDLNRNGRVDGPGDALVARGNQLTP